MTDVDRVKLGRRQLDRVIDEKIPVYEAKMNGDKPYLDGSGKGILMLKGGIQAGELGTRQEGELMVYKSSLTMVNKSDIVQGSETTIAYPVMLDTYKQIVWVPQEYLNIV